MWDGPTNIYLGDLCFRSPWDHNNDEDASKIASLFVEKV